MTDERIEQIRRAHESAKPDPRLNTAWANAHHDLGVVLDAYQALVLRLDKLDKRDLGGYCRMHGRHLGDKCPECPYEDLIATLQSRLGALRTAADDVLGWLREGYKRGEHSMADALEDALSPSAPSEGEKP